MIGSRGDDSSPERNEFYIISRDVIKKSNKTNKFIDISLKFSRVVFCWEFLAGLTSSLVASIKKRSRRDILYAWGEEKGGWKSWEEVGKDSPDRDR